MLRIPDETLKQLLVGKGLVSEDVFLSASEESARTGGNTADILVSRNIVPMSYIEQAIAAYLKVPLANLKNLQIDLNALKLLPEDIARQKRAVIFGYGEDGVLNVAMEDPSDLVSIQFLEKYLKIRVKPYFASADDLNSGFALYGAQSAMNFKQIIDDNIRESLKSKAENEEEAASDIPIVAIVDNLISYAMSLRSSDIHLEVFEEFILVRYRVDGILHEVMRIPKQVHSAIAARLKLLGGLKIDEHLKPQDGRFRYKTGNDIIDVRVAVMPTFYGEKVEMRLLPATTRPLSFAELGMLDDTKNILEENIKRTYGMVLVCGPTGSGKTTTLYSVLNVLNRPEVNIVTIEDPVEYDISFINQTQVNSVAGIDFANGLRAILRQDPNVIMVGEIRDEETAEIAVQSSLTGHLVLSSLHTNDAPTAIPRLIDMGIEPFLVAAVLNAILAQRLVRRIHIDCIESYEPDEFIIKAVSEQMSSQGFSDEEIKERLPRRLYRGKGCAADGGTGYQGRVGIFEVVNITEAVRGLIVGPSLSLDEVQRVARKEGMITMFEDGLRKVERGMTTIDEVLRVIQE